MGVSRAPAPHQVFCSDHSQPHHDPCAAPRLQGSRRTPDIRGRMKVANLRGGIPKRDIQMIRPHVLRRSGVERVEEGPRRAGDRPHNWPPHLRFAAQLPQWNCPALGTLRVISGAYSLPCVAPLPLSSWHPSSAPQRGSGRPPSAACFDAT